MTTNEMRTPDSAEVIRKWRNFSYTIVAILAVISVGIFVLNEILLFFVNQATTLCTGLAACPPIAADNFSILMSLFATMGVVMSLTLFTMIRRAKNGKAPNWWSSMLSS